MHSCNKHEITDQPVTGNGEAAMSEADLDIFNKIVSFRDKITYINENPAYKSGEVTTVDSAIWYLDATLNLSHAFISWETLAGFYYDSVFVTIPKVNGAVNYTDLADAYAELKQKVANVCIEAPGSEKELYIATLTEKEDTGNSITIKAEATIGSRSTAPPPPDHHPFYEGWLYGDLAGNCVGSPPYIGVADACTELRDTTNYYRDLYIDDEQMFYFSTPNEDPYVTLKSQHFAFINPNDPDPEDNYYEHLLVYQKEEWDYHDCIEEEQMNWYYHKLNYVIYQMVPNNPIFWPNANGKTFIEIRVDPEHTYGTKDEFLQIIRHQYKVEYRNGFFVGGNSEPESIVEN